MRWPALVHVAFNRRCVWAHRGVSRSSIVCDLRCEGVLLVDVPQATSSLFDFAVLMACLSWQLSVRLHPGGTELMGNITSSISPSYSPAFRGEVMIVARSCPFLHLWTGCASAWLRRRKHSLQVTFQTPTPQEFALRWPRVHSIIADLSARTTQFTARF